jgi:hypothetical protein
MPTWKLPLKAKIYEALSAVGDGRVQIKDGTRATVTSSERNKSYLVIWSAAISQITSNDNASYYQGYLGYPIMAVLMSLGQIQFDEDIARDLSGIDWTLANKKFKNKYDQAIDFILSEKAKKGIDTTRIRLHVDEIMRQLEDRSFERLPIRIPPPTER